MMGGRRFRLVIARVLGGASYNLAACAYLIILAIAVSVILPLVVSQEPHDQQTVLEGLAVFQYTARASIATTIVGALVAFIVGAVSLLLLVWVPLKIAQFGSRIAQKISTLLFDDPLSGSRMLIAKVLLYGPAMMILIVLYFIFSSELAFQLLVAGTCFVLAATLCAALRTALSSY